MQVLFFPTGMSLFLRNISVHGVTLDALLDESNTEWPQVAALFSDGIKKGVIKPMQRTVFGSDHLEEAFRYMARAQHLGKIVIKVWALIITSTVPLTYSFSNVRKPLF